MDLYEQISRDEGNRLRLYVDTRGIPTIGRGRNLRDKGINAQESMMLFKNDVQDAKEDLARALPWTGTMDEPRYAVLVNMVFNMGLGRFLGFRKMLEACQRQDWQVAHDELLDSDYARAEDTGPRAARLAQQLLTGNWV